MMSSANISGQDMLEPLVLKQSWLPEPALTEAEFCEGVPRDYICDILSSVAVCHTDGVQDDTANSIRHHVENLTDFSLEQTSDAYPRKKRKRSETQSLATENPIVNRVLIRTLMKTYGWHVTFFLDLYELVGTIRDSIQGEYSLRLYRLSALCSDARS